MRVLVTGGGGFIGSHVAEYYAKLGNEVVVFDNLSRGGVLGAQGALHNWNYLQSLSLDICFVKGDVRRFEEVKNAARDVDVIVHAAAQVAVTTSLKDPRLDFEVNALGTFNVLEAARLCDAAVIYCSTNKVYGENVNKIPVRDTGKRYEFADPKYAWGIPEDFPVDLCGHSPYGCSKLSGDIYVQEYGKTYGLKTGVFRMSCIYGERQFGTEEQGWVSWFTISCLKGQPITIYGDGKQVRDVLYVGDLVKAYDAFIRRKVESDVFNIGGGIENTISLLELLKILEEMTGVRATISFSNWRMADQKVYISDISKAKEKLNWKPETPLLQGIKKLINWVESSIHIL
ncbi:MAG: NAD-dependent epimerase/dehydratase family protein [Candidatus Freyarchaeota archaeon]